jgi:hypothetical protein
MKASQKTCQRLNNNHELSGEKRDENFLLQQDLSISDTFIFSEGS